MANQVVRVRREAIVACMTCPLCDKLLKDATTISECLHSFCRKCIYDKISAEELECCPICNIDLGCVPLEKLRPDHNLQDVRAKVFPFKRRKVKAPESAPSTSLPIRRKERSLSQLVVNTPKVSSQTTMTGKRTKVTARKASVLQGSNFSIEKAVKKEEDSTGDRLESSSSPETLSKFAQNIRQGFTSSEPSQTVPERKTGDEKKSQVWEPLQYLVEVANRTKSSRPSLQGPERVLAIEAPLPGNKIKNNKFKVKVQDEKNDTSPASTEVSRPKRLRKVRQKRTAVSGESGISPQDVLDAAGTKCEQRTGPIWFSLIASEDQEGDAPLPQIPASYLRIKDGNLPVSFIQKYLVRKLDLASETEVEIRCMGQTVLPTLLLYNLVDLWLQTASTSERVPAIVGSSAKDFVMVLAYARRVPDR
ncbi:hypothetical protein BT93_L5170 [Corymbia citriodora subsp. variegata]|uniref:RING-type domain-containing protein n=1 Tax=Corymbia citriodora subsp. variegata TaxID=360336 RepID=A0A8T0CSL4_CORYI|nr:hypothetical protein BT93_L5170 [Corymbia citriodora subsp. variegata]